MTDGLGDTSLTWHDVLHSSDLPHGAGKDVVIDGEVIAVFRVEGRLYALDGLCAHQGGPISEGYITKDSAGNPCVTCPWHGWQYELSTGIQCVNRQALQRTFSVREVGDRIHVAMNLH